MSQIHSSTLSLQPGLYLLRHPGQGQAPIAIARSPLQKGNNGQWQTLGTAGQLGNVLRDGSDCVVTHIEGGPVELLISVVLAQADSPLPALRVDQVALQPRAEAEPVPAPAPAAAPQSAPAIEVGPHGISLIGHVEAGGDQVAPQGELLGDPESLRRLEGFQAVWPDRPDGVDLQYGISCEGAAPSADVLSGQFCGTRQQARRLTEVHFRLVGPKAREWRLEGNACFSGGFLMPVVEGMALTGPSGAEHLTALQLRAVPADAPGKPAGPWDPSARTTVFSAPAKTRRGSQQLRNT
jgi:hypothetical protein